MFRAHLTLAWQWLRLPLALLSLVGAAIPVLGISSPWTVSAPSVDAILASAGLVGLLIAVVAVLAGAITGDVLWRQDARHGHSYAMSLPIRRDTFLRYRAACGALLLLVPAIAIFLGIAAINVGAELPPGVRTYAWETASRAWVVMVMALSLTLGLRLGLGVRGRRVLMGAAMLMTVALWLEPQVSAGRPTVGAVITVMFTGRYSPFAVLFSAWPVIDL
ncbi:MAG: hypothetical protein JNL26_19540 [Gemmatimonadetes bacterium]|nr:hypothetical protein [Gemmatimonadota bacterium]